MPNHSCAIHSRPGHTGFTLLELLTVLVIIGVLTAMIMPFSNRLDNDARRRNTDAAFERIREAILGPRGQVDPLGRPLIGGYAGDTGELPRLVATRWSTANGGWIAPDDDHDDILDLAEPYGSASFNFTLHGHAQPLGLWTNSTRDGDGDWVSAAPAGWAGPYLETPRDPYPDDNGLQYSNDGGVEDRMFLLLECEGRLNDGWSRAFLVLTEEDLVDGAPQSLVFVSAGPDGSYDPTTLLDLDPTGSNADNLVYRITRNEYDNTTTKTLRTRAMLEGLRSALVPPRRTVQDTQALPSGYSADLGGLDTLFGSLVYDEVDGRVYLCAVSHSGRTSPPRSDSNYWTEAAADRTLYPAVPKWRENDAYFRPKPYLLFANADFVEEDEVVYRCAQASCTNTPPSSQWVEAPEVAFPEFELEDAQGTVATVAVAASWNTLATYNGTAVMPPWAVHAVANQPALPLGWKGGYARPAVGDPALWLDSWGRPLTVRLDTGRNFHLVSQGPSSSDDADDITLTIYRQEYEVPVEARVSNNTGTHITPSSDALVDLWTPLNGKLCVWRNETGGGGPDFFFRFGSDENVVNPKTPDWRFTAVYSGNSTDEGAFTLYEANESAPARFIPVGQAYLEYRQENFTSDVSETAYGSPHPSLTWVSGNATAHGPSTCQKSILLYPGESRVGAGAVPLCE